MSLRVGVVYGAPPSAARMGAGPFRLVPGHDWSVPQPQPVLRPLHESAFVGGSENASQAANCAPCALKSSPAANDHSSLYHVSNNPRTTIQELKDRMPFGY